MKKLQEVIKQVNEAEKRIDDLKRVKFIESNPNYRGETKVRFLIDKGNVDGRAVCINHKAFFKAIDEAIEYEESKIAKDKQMLAAMELMLGGEVESKLALESV